LLDDQIAVNAALVSTPLYTHFTRRFALYTLTPAAGSIGALLLNWAAEITGADSERRAIVIGGTVLCLLFSASRRHADLARALLVQLLMTLLIWCRPLLPTTSVAPSQRAD
jgi:hypothetical protein